MSPENRAKAIFLSAIDIAADGERNQYLDAECGADESLRSDVEALLQHHARMGRFLESAAPDLIPALPIAEQVGTTIGPYKLLEEIGEGGMGVVYMAEQREPVHRKVALKIIKPGMDSREVIARFEAERQALALMNHPHIATVLDAGATEAGRPYFAMELVKGVPITDFCDQQRLNMGERLRLFVNVCQAIQHAHQKGVIHRDIKPSNVLVEVHDVVPVPKVIDFGVAKAIGQQLTDKTLHTGFQQMVGTPLYTSPEQAGQSSLDVDTRSDVYSLGVLLYELLTGTTPFERETLRQVGPDELRRMIREVDPPCPSARVSTLNAESLSTVSSRRRMEPRKLSQQLRGDLDWIVMKALEKDRNRRYESASALAADVERYLSHEPIQARPPSTVDHMWKWIRRHRAITLSAAVSLAVCLLVLAVSALLILTAYQREREQRKIAAANAVRAERNLEKARGAVDDMYVGVAEKWLAPQAALTSVQREFLEKALVLYRDFAEEKAFDPQVRNEAVVALQRVGAIQQKLGDLAAAEKSFRDALKEGEILTRQHSDRPEFRMELLSSRVSLAEVYRSTGRSKDADQEAERASGELAKLGSPSFADVKYRRRLADALQHLCTQLTLAHRLPEAEAAVGAARKTWESLVADFPAEIEYRYGLAGNYSHQGIQRMWWGDQDDAAESALREATTRLSKLLEEHPDDARFRSSLARTLTNLGVMLSRRNRLEEQVETTHRAMRLLERLAADSPDVPDYQASWADALHNVAGAEKDLGRIHDSESHYRAAIDICERLADRHSYELENVLSCCGTAHELSFVLARQKKYDEACQVLERVVSRTKTALKDNPAQRSLMVQVVNCSTGLAATLTQLGNHVRASQTVKDLLPLFTSARGPNVKDPPATYEAVHPGELLMSEASEMLFVVGILRNCMALAERDPVLSPREREHAVHAYSEQAEEWLTAATGAVDSWARNEWKKSRQFASAIADAGEMRIQRVEQLQRNADLTPSVREAAVSADAMLVKMLIRKAVELAPDDSQMYQMADVLSSAPQGLRDPELALELARRACELKPDDGMRLQSLGWALYRVGDWNNCVASLKQQRGVDESDFVLAMAHWQLGQKSDAQVFFRRGREWLKSYEQRCADRAKQGTHTWPPPRMLQRFQREAADLLQAAVPVEKTPPVPQAKPQPLENKEPEPQTETN